MALSKASSWRNFAYVAVDHAECRAAISEILTARGWRVEHRSSGFDLLDDLCDIISNERTQGAPDLLVIDRHARGCSGTTIAHGLRDLGVDIPIVLVNRPGERVEPSGREGIIHVDSARAATVIARIVV